ncbi:MAG: hypothetical protein D6713_09250 [Deltaproteobacteria bacterium]|nr:MAG: hypothetical protein D6713_09250 [Deltaproteobacteria bacterium]
MKTLIVDGYNLAHRLYGNMDLEEMRETLLEMISLYGSRKRRRVTVVFDGSSMAPTGKESRKWVSVLYSRPPEKADDLIARLASERGEGAVIVTSDRGLAARVEQKGAHVVTCEEYARILDRCFYEEMKGEEEERERKREKKGPSRRPPRKERMKKKILDWL